MLNGRNDRKRNVGAVLARFVFTINRQYTNRMPDREKVKETVRQARSVLSSDTQVAEYYRIGKSRCQRTLGMNPDLAVE